VSDADFVNEKWNKIINSLRDDFNKWEKHTLKQYIQDCAEIIELKIEYGLLNIQLDEVSSYLNKEFIKQEIDVSDRTIRDSLEPKYKRNYSNSEVNAELNSSKWIKKIDEDNYLVEQDQHGNYRINGQEFSKKKPSRPVEEKESRPRKEITDNYTKILKIGSKCGNLVERIFEALYEEYQENEDARNIVKNIYFNITKDLERYLKIHADLTLARNELDKREKWGDYEKLMFAFLIEVGDTKADLAEKVGYCSKYASIGIERNEDLEKYKKFARNCPKCNEDIAHEMNRNIQIYKSGEELDIETPIKGY
jgi:hypothetical protein